MLKSDVKKMFCFLTVKSFHSIFLNSVIFRSLGDERVIDTPISKGTIYIDLMGDAMNNKTMLNPSLTLVLLN